MQKYKQTLKVWGDNTKKQKRTIYFAGTKTITIFVNTTK